MRCAGCVCLRVFRRACVRGCCRQAAVGRACRPKPARPGAGKGAGGAGIEGLARWREGGGVGWGGGVAGAKRSREMAG